MSNGYATNWTVQTINGVDYLTINTAQLRIPLDWDPSSAVFVAVAAPNGALPYGTAGFPALVAGPAGTAAAFSSAVNFSGLAWDDPTADYAYLTETSPGVWQLSLGVHDGSPALANIFKILQAADMNLHNLVAGAQLVVNNLTNGITLQMPQVGDQFLPALIKSISAGNPFATLTSISIPAMPWDWRPHIGGHGLVQGTGVGNVLVNLVARLNDEINGNIVGIAKQLPGLKQAIHVLVSGSPPGSAANYNVVPAGTPATIFLRAEQQSGADSFTINAGDVHFTVDVKPVPNFTGTSLAFAPSVPVTTTAGSLTSALTGVTTSLGQTSPLAVATNLSNFGGTITTDIQTALDHLGNTLGLGGSGFSLATVVAKLQTIAGKVTAGVQSALDSLANVLGSSGVGHAITDVVSLLNGVTLPITTDLQNAFDTFAGALGGGGTGNSVTQMISLVHGSALPVTQTIQNALTNITTAIGGTNVPAVVSNLESFTGTITTDIQNTVDTVANLIGLPGSGHPLATVASNLRSLFGL
jgi:hypothetical protein